MASKIAEADQVESLAFFILICLRPRPENSFEGLQTNEIAFSSVILRNPEGGSH